MADPGPPSPPDLMHCSHGTGRLVGFVCHIGGGAVRLTTPLRPVAMPRTQRCNTLRTGVAPKRHTDVTSPPARLDALHSGRPGSVKCLVWRMWDAGAP